MAEMRCGDSDAVKDSGNQNPLPAASYHYGNHETDNAFDGFVQGKGPGGCELVNAPTYLKE